MNKYILTVYVKLHRTYKILPHRHHQEILALAPKVLCDLRGLVSVKVLCSKILWFVRINHRKFLIWQINHSHRNWIISAWFDPMLLQNDWKWDFGPYFELNMFFRAISKIWWRHGSWISSRPRRSHKIVKA